MDNLEGRFNKVRYGDLKTRKRWFLTSVIILFVVILGIWLIIFKDSLPGSSVTGKADSGVGGFGEFWSSFKNGLSILKEKISAAVSSISEIVGK
ncbi:MAG: hypothetical protein UV58_C0009G0004 [Candidatus Wolfebacteria bacterium GW2011_GWC1_43_10]|uniref:Uncharacterized protein n=1 Tax=Candidatus Wolfebacteria bacterium GW2011_GWC1_43_10 TaxID=1619011 RepID=A0A0G1CAD2_9BACT|nr:MAG: hypothetical protein UV58_C0009G0004 [Candidatus Wolfebacteria bacterium GW2011_GWC1_43_10]KKT23117.1 MAG: hypothetical protein UW08_C0001G0080 [Parcubacteria group bacterium GW2011_GWB1_43_8b]KKT85604.1 MAG: hypothetical protein UW85_C0017G0008 [Parcubacteria group bacterium GW2011_GWA1_Parcubacteria_45_10]